MPVDEGDDWSDPYRARECYADAGLDAIADDFTTCKTARGWKDDAGENLQLVSAIN